MTKPRNPKQIHILKFKSQKYILKCEINKTNNLKIAARFNKSLAMTAFFFGGLKPTLQVKLKSKEI